MKEKIEEIVEKVKNDKDFMNKFKENPVKAVEEVLGVDLPEEQINNIVETVKAKINLDEGGLLDKVKEFLIKIKKTANAVFFILLLNFHRSSHKVYLIP